MGLELLIAFCPPLHPTMPIEPSKVTSAGDYEGADKSKKKNEWEIVRKRKEYHLVVTPDTFQSSLELDFCC